MRGSGRHLVEQYKTRPDGTWSVRNIIDDVLPDLRKAVPEPPTLKAIYRFVTDGRKGRLHSFQKFLSAVRSAASPDDLDDTEGYRFANGLPTTFRSLFDYIVTKTARKERPRTDAAASVFHLLSKFEMEFEVLADHRARDVERLLRLYCSDLGDEEGARHRLVGMLMDRLSTGETLIGGDCLDGLFREAGLDPERMRKLASLNETLASFVNDELNRVKYLSFPKTHITHYYAATRS